MTSNLIKFYTITILQCKSIAPPKTQGYQGRAALSNEEPNLTLIILNHARRYTSNREIKHNSLIMCLKKEVIINCNTN